MKYFSSVTIDKSSQIPLYRQLGDAICRMVEEGVLFPNTKLPPIRTMARCLKINNVTVVSAYKYLENKKIVYSQVGSGTYISPIPINSAPEPIKSDFPISEKNDLLDLKSAINFVSTSVSEELFPVEEFKNAFNEILEKEKGNAFKNEESQGYLPLRENICSYIMQNGIKTSAQNIQIISGAQQGIDIVAKAMMTFNDVIFVEKPTYYGAIGAFMSRGGKIIEVPIKKDGMDMDMLENLLKLYRPRLIYVMTYFQTPTGISYSIDKKRKLLELVEKYDTYIIEEDSFFDFNYTSKPILPLKSLDYKNRVIYIKSFSKILMPGLRMGFMVIPPKILKDIAKAKYNSDISTSGIIQKAFNIYIKKNSWNSHVEAMKNYGMQKYKIMIKSIDRHLSKYVSYIKPKGGVSIWVKILPPISSERLCKDLIKRNVILSPGSLYTQNEFDDNYIRICFANVSDDKIDIGIRRIRDCIEKNL